ATPDRGALEGITRRTVLAIAADQQLAAEPRPIPAEELRGAGEIFLTSTAGGIIPVTTLDGRPVGDGVPGPVTLRIKAAYWRLHEVPEMATPVPYD
ncbi:MAG TPA: aminotransferase class IV, partial [Pararhizobium sp.]|nr:aminotransferase class IV [Pararhizobium sp.]